MSLRPDNGEISRRDQQGDRPTPAGLERRRDGLGRTVTTPKDGARLCWSAGLLRGPRAPTTRQSHSSVFERRSISASTWWRRSRHSRAAFGLRPTPFLIDRPSKRSAIARDLPVAGWTGLGGPVPSGGAAANGTCADALTQFRRNGPYCDRADDAEPRVGQPTASRSTGRCSTYDQCGEHADRRGQCQEGVPGWWAKCQPVSAAHTKQAA